MSSEDDLQTQKPNHPPQQLVSNFAPSENDHVSRCLSTYEMFFHPKMYQDQANPTSKRWNSIFWTIPNIEQPQKRIRTRKLQQNRSNLNKTSKAWKNISIKQLPFRKTKLRKTGKISCKTPHRLPIVFPSLPSPWRRFCRRSPSCTTRWWRPSAAAAWASMESRPSRSWCVARRKRSHGDWWWLGWYCSIIMVSIVVIANGIMVCK